MVLFGPSGSGKTTILRCLAGLDRPQEGVHPVRRRGLVRRGSRRSTVRRSARRLAYVVAGLRSVSASHRRAEHSVRDGRQRADVATESRRFCERSIWRGWPAASIPFVGRRAAASRAGARAGRDPRLILLDEPLAALDLPLRDPMRQELRQFLRSIDVPSVIVTHDRVDALTLGDRMAVLSGGLIRQVGPVHEVFSRPADLAVAASVGVETVVPGRWSK